MNSEVFRTSPYLCWVEGKSSPSKGIGRTRKKLSQGQGHGWGLLAVGWSRIPGPRPDIQKQLLGSNTEAQVPTLAHPRWGHREHTDPPVFSFAESDDGGGDQVLRTCE